MKLLKRLFILSLMFTVIGCSEESVDDVSEDTPEIEVEASETAEPVDSPDDNTIMTEEEILEIDGHTWNAYSEDEKFHAVSNFMYLMSEESGWSFAYSEMEYASLIDDAYSDSTEWDKQFAAIFILIHTLEES
jgi:hypothetical protein